MINKDEQDKFMKKYYPAYKGTREQMMRYLEMCAILSEKEDESGRPRTESENEGSLSKKVSVRKY